jgi:hypothetical protein
MLEMGIDIIGRGDRQGHSAPGRGAHGVSNAGKWSSGYGPVTHFRSSFVRIPYFFIGIWREKIRI